MQTISVYLFKVNDKNTRKVCKYAVFTLNYFNFLGVSIVHFEQANVGWVNSK